MSYNQTGTITLRIVAQDLASGNFSKAISGMDAMAKKGGLVGSVMQGVGISFGMMLNPLALVSQGIGLVTDTFGDMLAQAKEGEVANAHLTESLKASVPAWDGQMEAINRVIDSRIRLGFEDNQQQDALAALVAHTHDVTKALDAERVAMDLARFKQIDLAQAAQLVGKAWDGNSTALKKMGIQLDKGAKGTQALAGIEKVAGGQAEAFAGTLAGKQASLDASIAKVEESIGSMIIGPAADLLGWFSDIIAPAGKAADAMTDATAAIWAQVDALHGHAAAAKEDATLTALNEDWAQFQRIQSQLAAQAGIDTVQFIIANQEKAKAAGIAYETLRDFYLGEQSLGKTAAQTQIDWNLALVKSTVDWSQITVAAVQDTVSAVGPLYGYLNRYSTEQLVAEAKMVAGTQTYLAGWNAAWTKSADVTATAVDAIEVDLSSLVGITRTTLKDAEKEAHKGMAGVIWALKHPMEEAKLDKEFHHELTQAEHALDRAFKEGNPVAIAKARALVQGIKDAIAGLETAHISLTADLSYYNQQRSGQGGVGTSSRPPGSFGGNNFSAGGAGGPINIHFNGMVTPPSPADAQRIGNVIGPIVARHLQSSGHL